MTDTNDPFPTFADDTPMPVVLRTLAGWLEGHPEVVPSWVELQVHQDKDDAGAEYLKVFAERYGVEASMHHVEKHNHSWATLGGGVGARARLFVHGPYIGKE